MTTMKVLIAAALAGNTAVGRTHALERTANNTARNLGIVMCNPTTKIASVSKYTPHIGKKECERRLKQQQRQSQKRAIV